MSDLWDRFWEKVDRTGECWEWTGSKDGKGYGQIRETGNGRLRIASRVAWEMTRGTLPPGVSVLHRCDNPPCVRPTHLFTGDPLVNMQDAAAKGRLSTPRERPRGERHHNASLTDAEVSEMRRLRTAGVTTGELARRFNCAYQTAWRITTGRGRVAA